MLSVTKDNVYEELVGTEVGKGNYELSQDWCE
jgi:hypothetical protein